MQRQRQRMLADAVVAGVIGYGVVAVLFAAANVVSGQSAFHTASMLGEALFAGLRDPAATVIDVGMMLAFNGVHLGAFLAFGLFAAWLVYETETHAELWYLAFLIFIGVTLLSVAGVLALTLLAGGLLPAWLVAVGAGLGAMAMAAYLLAGHGAMLRAIRGSGQPRPGTFD